MIAIDDESPAGIVPTQGGRLLPAGPGGDLHATDAATGPQKAAGEIHILRVDVIQARGDDHPSTAVTAEPHSVQHQAQVQIQDLDSCCRPGKGPHNIDAMGPNLPVVFVVQHDGSTGIIVQYAGYGTEILPELDTVQAPTQSPVGIDFRDPVFPRLQSQLPIKGD